MVKLNKNQNFGLYFKYALRDLTRSYNKISSIIITLFISLFILSSIMTIEDSLENELNENAKLFIIKRGDHSLSDTKSLKMIKNQLTKIIKNIP